MKIPSLTPVFSVLLVAACLVACVGEDLPVIDTGKGIVAESREKLEEEIILGPDFEPVMLNFMLDELTPLLLEEPGMRSLENWYNLKSSWREKYGAEENMQLYANLIFEKFFKEENFKDAAKVKLAQGRIHYLGNRYEEAIDHGLKAFELSLAAGDSVTMARALDHLAGPFFYAGNVGTAREYLNRSLRIAKLIDSQPVIASVNMGMGIIMGRTGRIDSAMYFFETALAISREQKMTEYTDLIVANMSASLLRAGRPREAIELIRLNGWSMGGKVTISNSLLSLTYGEASLELGEFNEALEYLEKGCAMSEQLEIAYGQLNCLRLMSAYHEQTGNTPQALAFYKKFHEKSQLDLNEAARKSIEVSEAELKVRDRNRQIEKLQWIENEREKTFVRTLWILFSSAGALAIGGLSFFHVARSRDRLKIADQKRIAAEAKLNVLQFQMKPHFIYNALNGVLNYILKTDTIKAYNYLSKFAALLRIITKSSVNIFIELEVEIALLKNYLELEQMRFRKAFTFNFEVDESLLQENLNIPNMMIQPVVENAIIHGLSGREGDGLIDISIRRDGEQGILCTVTDNGRGRAAAAEIARRRGEVHLSIASINSAERIKSLHELGFPNTRLEIKDLFNDGAACGTRVYIFLPFIENINTKLNGTKHRIGHR